MYDAPNIVGRGHQKNFAEISRIPSYPPTTTVTAYEPATGADVWQQVLPAVTFGASSGSMVTAGDLLFQGTEDGGFYAFHAATGEELFSHDAGRTLRSSPLTYEINGRQYVAIIVSGTVLAFALSYSLQIAFSATGVRILKLPAGYQMVERQESASLPSADVMQHQRSFLKESPMHCFRFFSLTSSIIFVVLLGLSPIRSDAQGLGQLYIEVITASGEAVEGLAPEHFSIINDGNELEIVSAELEDTPMTVALMVDNGDRIAQANSINALRDGMLAFLDTLPPQHEVGLYTVGRNVRQRVEFSTDRDELRESASEIFADSGAPMMMLDGIRETMERRLEDDDTFPVFVMLLTDGSEGSSNYSDNQYQELINNLRLDGVTIHVIMLSSRGGNSPVTQYAQNLVDNTGGQYQPIALPTGFAPALTDLATRLGNHFDNVSKRYRVVYEIPENGGPQISVSVQAPGSQMQVYPDRRMP